MFKVGIELEEFCVDKLTEEIALAPAGVSHDDCGWLLEYRSRPCSNITEAVFSMQAHEYTEKIRQEKEGVFGLREPIAKPSKKVRLAARRRFIKSLVKFNNLYGYTSHRNNLSEAVAGIHISITSSEKGEYGRVNKLWDFADFIRHMDKTFLVEIKGAKRRPGFYEIKSDGRFEYRSLPNNVDLDRLIDVISNYDFKL